jgi:hypothetical protein
MGNNVCFGSEFDIAKSDRNVAEVPDAVIGGDSNEGDQSLNARLNAMRLVL